MQKRREFIKFCMKLIAGVGVSSAALFSAAGRALAEIEKIILPKGTKRRSLIGKNPAALDTRNLEVTPLEDFETMGITDHEVDLSKWRLEVDGLVKTPLRLTYSEILDLPFVEKEILLICPGFFANHGRWKGISMKELLAKAGAGNEVSHVIFRGPEGTYEKVESFPIEEVLAGKVFPAYQVNGETLPKKHGFPLRVAAEGHYGFEWVKYVHKMTFEKS